MSTEYRVVPVEPTGEMEEAGCQAYMEADGYQLVMHKSSMGHAFKAMLGAAPERPAEKSSTCAKSQTEPVPSAGGEHPTVCHRRFTTWIDQKTGGAMLGQVVIAEDFDALLCSHEDHRAHVTRLQAENEHLLGEHEDLLEKFNNLGGELDALKAELRSLRKELADTESDVETIAEHNIELQSEPTKARELIKEQDDLIRSGNMAARNESTRAKAYELSGKASAFLAHQSASAIPRCDHCGYTEKDCREQMDHYLCGFPEPALAAKDGE